MSSTDEPQPDQPEDEAVPDEAAADETAPDETTADAVVPDEGPAPRLDDLSTGPNAHGHGRTADQRRAGLALGAGGNGQDLLTRQVTQMCGIHRLETRR